MAEKYLAEFLLPTQPTVELDFLGFQALVESVLPPKRSWCLMAEKYLAEFLLPTQPTVELDFLGFQALVESVLPPKRSQK
jgi:hypothetical protein